jgi:hypothetical protein
MSCTSARPVIGLGVCALLAVSLTACDMPTFEGPQIQSPPPAFFLQPDSYLQERIFPAREMVYHDAWISTADGIYSGIYINGHAGVISEADVLSAQEAAKVRATTPITFGPIERHVVDGREALGWAERLQTPELGIDWIAYRMVVPYDTVTYALEFYGGAPGLKSHPDTLVVILSSFAIGETTWNLGLIAILVGGGLLLVNVMRNRARKRAVRLQGITLKQVPKGEMEHLMARKTPPGSGGGATPGGGAGMAGAGMTGAGMTGGTETTGGAGTTAGAGNTLGGASTPPQPPRPATPREDPDDSA